MSDEKQVVITGNFEVAVHLTDKRTLKMVGYVYSADTLEDINRRIDTYQDALDRQAIRCDVTVKEAQVVSILDGIEHLTERIKDIKSKREQGMKVSSQEKNLLDQHDNQITGAMGQVNALRSAIEAGKRKLNGSAAHAQ